MPQADIVSVPVPKQAITHAKATNGTSLNNPAPNGSDAKCKDKKNGENGSPGNNGGNGDLAQNGLNGIPAGNVTIHATMIIGQLTLYVGGGDASAGQEGGDGGKGQTGGNGGKPAKCDWNSLDGGEGGIGGNGGNGSAGGDGGKGGDAPIITILYGQQPSDVPSIKAFQGTTGAGGKGGMLGVPGPGGYANGGSGPQANSGTAGTNGEPGKPGKNGLPSHVTLKSGLPPPTLSAISPNSGPDETTVTITGDYFQSGAKVMIGSLELNNTKVVSASKITGNIPVCQHCFKVGVMITNPDEGCGAVAEMYTYS